MCGRYTIRRVDLLVRPYAQEQPAFEEFDDKRIVPRFNAAPTQTLPVLKPTAHGVVLTTMRWGLVPSWAKDKKIGNSLINARAETVATKPSFRAAFAKRRCLIPADGFYEWKHLRPEDGKGPKMPYYIHLKSHEPFVFAGLWEFWEGPEGPLETFTILTTAPNTLMEPLHDRMPVMLTADRARRWISPEATRHELQAMLTPFDAGLMDAYPVSTQVNSPRNESPDLIVPTA